MSGYGSAVDTIRGLFEPDGPRETPSIPRDEALGVLKSARRRWVLRTLRERPGGIEIGTLAERLAAEENGVQVRDLSCQERKRVYIGLHQTHIPRLERWGIVGTDDDADGRRYRLTGSPACSVVLDLLDEHDRRWGSVEA